MSDNKQSALQLSANLSDADDFYEELLRAHEGLDDAQSEAYNARLILILCNHIGNRETLSQALAAARLPS